MRDKASLKNVIDVASGRVEADFCISGSLVLDVYNKEWFETDVLISQGVICGFCEKGEGTAKQIVVAKGKYLVPGFIDSHVHIESSHCSPAEFSNLVVPCGTTTVIADPHEICNVCGLAGLDYMLEDSKNTALQAFFMVPSCVPATPFEHSGAILLAPELAKGLRNERVLGLGEMMDYPGVIAASPMILDKIWEAKLAGKLIDGHSPAIEGKDLDAYSAASIHTDHECETPEELKQRVRRGMYVMLRQGSACCNVLGLLKGVTSDNSRRCLFCTDDRQPKSILKEGHINNNVRLAVEGGLDPIEALCMATINSAECYHLYDRGAIAPGLRADFLLYDDLKDFSMPQVYVGGVLVAERGKIITEQRPSDASMVSGKMQVKNFSVDRLVLPLKADWVRVIDIISGGVVTGAGEAYVTVKDGKWRHDAKQDILKLAVIERHHGTGNVAVALLRGYGLKGGAIATSVAHDSHNIIVCGDNDEDMVLAVNHLVALGGGMVLVKKGKILSDLPLPIAGLMTGLKGKAVAARLEELHSLAHEELSVNDTVDPFMTLCFMSLPVIPTYKLTDMGLFDVRKFDFVPLEL
ncbi:adenine deaminase [uncultured Sphaerochaeta sp.]|uniref:adenine deaminase n=1 Tax=uncultured Sphaerochaeta sp. TaxID=886478 RepID=UPI002A0A5E97|nr:adenine deaminase [uncultured Sphaerochaeta sp.]